MITTTAGHTNITYDADDSAPRDQHTVALPPDPIELIVERIVVVNVAELIRMIVVLLQVEVRRRRDNKMNRLIGNPIQIAGVAEIQKKFKQFMGAAAAPGALDVATKQAINIALSVLARCGPCVKSPRRWRASRVICR